MCPLIHLLQWMWWIGVRLAAGARAIQGLVLLAVVVDSLGASRGQGAALRSFAASASRAWRSLEHVRQVHLLGLLAWWTWALRARPGCLVGSEGLCEAQRALGAGRTRLLGWLARA